MRTANNRKIVLKIVEFFHFAYYHIFELAIECFFKYVMLRVNKTEIPFDCIKSSG